MRDGGLGAVEDDIVVDWDRTDLDDSDGACRYERAEPDTLVGGEGVECFFAGVRICSSRCPPSILPVFLNDSLLCLAAKTWSLYAF